MKLELCPSCSSNKIETDVLGVTSTCLTCRWEGDTKKLIVTQTKSDRLEIAEKVSQTYLLLLTQRATPVIGECMIRAGLIGGNEGKTVLSRVLREVTLAAHKATLDTLEQIQKEQNGIATA